MYDGDSIHDFDDLITTSVLHSLLLCSHSKIYVYSPSRKFVSRTAQMPLMQSSDETDRSLESGLAASKIKLDFVANVQCSFNSGLRPLIDLQQSTPSCSMFFFFNLSMCLGVRFVRSQTQRYDVKFFRSDKINFESYSCEKEARKKLFEL